MENEVEMKTLHPGNAAIECQIFTMNIDTAKKIRTYMKKELNVSRGSYWYNHVVRPVNRAVRSYHTEVSIQTAGFSTSDFAGVLSTCGISLNNKGE